MPRCSQCRNPAELGKRKCRACLDRYNQYQINRMEAWKNAGLCIACGKRPPCERSKSRCEKCLARSRNAESRNSPARRAKNMRWRAALKEEVFRAYGGFICSCCGETEPKFLCLDHVYNDGAAHRKEIGQGGDRLLRWLKLHGFPTGFQVICANCNQGKQLNNGVCPHREKRDVNTA